MEIAVHNQCMASERHQNILKILVLYIISKTGSNKSMKNHPRKYLNKLIAESDNKVKTVKRENCNSSTMKAHQQR
jgi:hypothetical protein